MTTAGPLSAQVVGLRESRRDAGEHRLRDHQYPRTTCGCSSMTKVLDTHAYRVGYGTKQRITEMAGPLSARPCGPW
jgi:hypothetical protein